MPKVVSSQELDQIVDLIAQYPDGIGTEGLARVLGADMPRRTLQRRLSTLIEQQRIRAEGGARAIKYRLAPIIGTLATTQEENVLLATGEVYVPVSTEGEEIKVYVRQPRQLVSYKIGFLEQYHPNKTAYLPESLRAQLHTLGRSSASHAEAWRQVSEAWRQVLH